MCSRYGSVIMHTRPYRRLRDVIKVIFYYGDKKTAFQIYRNRVVCDFRQVAVK